MTSELVADNGAAAARLDVFLAQGLGITRSSAGRLLRDGAVLVNGAPQRPSYIVQPGDRVEIAEAETVAVLQPQAPELQVAYEDNDVIVINKPAGISVHPGAGLKIGEATVADFARLHTTDPDPERPGIVHRLDRDTTGLMIIAKTAAAKAFMQQQFREHHVHKTYTLLAVGRVTPPEAVIKLPLDRDPAHPLRRAVVAGGRQSVTRYHTVATYPGFTLLEASPETGRTHQLRVHFAAIGHPIAGDNLYGAKQPGPGLKRQFLHASALKFTAPSCAAVSLQSALPNDLATVVSTLEERI